MALIKSVRGFSPMIGIDCWFAETAVIVGDVVMGEQCSVWFNAVIRGDVNSIVIGDRSNIQDNVTIHGTYEKSSTKIGNDVSIGHNAIVHGCTLEDEVLIGMGARVMDGVVVGKGAIVAAGAVVLENSIIEPNSLWAGVPAKKIKMVEGKNREMQKRIAANYIRYSGWFKEEEKQSTKTES